MTLLLILLLAALGVGVAVLASSTGKKAVRIERIMARDFNSAYDGLRRLIQDNTR